MPARKTKPDAGRVVDVDALLAEPTVEQQLAEFFEGIAGNDVTCSIYELGGPRQTERGFLFSFPFIPDADPAELFERILATYGPGRYEFHAKEGHRFVEGGRRVFQLGSQRDRLRSILPDRAPDQQPAAAPSSQMSPELRAILDGQQKTLDLLARALTEREKPPTLREQLGELKDLRELFAPPETKATPMAELIDTIRTVFDLKHELTDEADDERNPLLAAVNKVAPAITKAIDRLSEPGAPSGTAPADQNGGAMMDLNALFAKLHAHAEHGDAPDAVAAAVFQYLAEQPQWVEQLVIGLVLEDEQVTRRLVSMYPKLEPHTDWLGSVVSVMQTELTRDGADTPAPTTTTPAQTQKPDEQGAAANAHSGS